MDYCDIKSKDVDLKRLGSILWLAQENQTQSFEDLLLLNGLGPRTLQSLALVSEVIHGTPSRFSDPARYAFAHGGKSGRPFPVPIKVYDETIETLTTAVEKAKLGGRTNNRRSKSLARWHKKLNWTSLLRVIWKRSSKKKKKMPGSMGQNDSWIG